MALPLTVSVGPEVQPGSNGGQEEEKESQALPDPASPGPWHITKGPCAHQPQRLLGPGTPSSAVPQAAGQVQEVGTEGKQGKEGGTPTLG